MGFEHFRNLVKKICNPLKGRFFFVILLLNLVSNFVWLRHGRGWTTIVGIIGCSAFIAYVESVIIGKVKVRQWRCTIQALLIIIHNIFIVCEYFLLLNFQMVISQEVTDILVETNPSEASNFLHSYLNVGKVTLYIGCIFLFNILLIKGSKYIRTRNWGQWMMPLVMVGMFFYAYCGYGFLRFRDGMNIPQYTTLTRTGYAFYLLKDKAKTIKKLTETCQRVKAVTTIKQKPAIVVIVGESFSVYHSSLYGYNKLTNPLLQQHKDNGNLIIMDDVLTLHDGTTASMSADFSLSSMGKDYTEKALWPVCFKKAGWHTEMYDNQYFVGAGLSFLTDKTLSALMFDKRNNERFSFDGDMVQTIQICDMPALYVIHLWGQHYEYAQRYPKQFAKFKPSDYDMQWNEEQRQIIAHYDNATLYNDWVINQIIRKFSSEDCLIIYFSDHGEEIYETRDYMGHGNAETAPNLNYQIRIPFMVWASSTYMEHHTEKWQRILRAKHYRMTTDDVGHALLDIADISTKDFEPTRSFINDRYHNSSHRIVLHSVDYDKEWWSKR